LQNSKEISTCDLVIRRTNNIKYTIIHPKISNCSRAFGSGTQANQETSRDIPRNTSIGGNTEKKSIKIHL
jgi:hypothetical protein